MTPAAPSSDEMPVVQRYEELVKTGVYSSKPSHAAPERLFVREVLGPVLVGLAGKPAKVLDCGCGTGEWLEFVAAVAHESGIGDLTLFGFDVTPGMVEVARARLHGFENAAVLFEGDVLDPASYRPEQVPSFDLVFTFDVIQQLPRSQQNQAVDLMLKAVRSGGVLVVFDHERQSGHGRRMGLKKWLTRYLRIPLVPAYYTASAYPSLARIAGRLDALPGVSAHVVISPTSLKRALVARPT